MRGAWIARHGVGYAMRLIRAAPRPQVVPQSQPAGPPRTNYDPADVLLRVSQEQALRSDAPEGPPLVGSREVSPSANTRLIGPEALEALYHWLGASVASLTAQRLSSSAPC
jgi:hypothetical protein